MNPFSLISLKWLFLVCLITFCSAGQAAWFSATGQAVVVNGDKGQARQEATEEAIRQAMLFAGASVTSVQQITNGLLLDDRLEVRSKGEVSAVELVDEIYHDGVVSVSIRADIFAQKQQCPASDYTKRISTTYFPIRYEGQAANGQVQDLGKELALKFQSVISKMSTGINLSHIEPYVFNWYQADVVDQAKFLAQKTNTQYVLSLSIDDISVELERPSAFEFYKGNKQSRAFDFTLTLFNGATGDEIFANTYRSDALWEFDSRDSVDVGSQRFWQSQYGQNIIRKIQHSISDIEELTRCKPTMGRVLAVANNQLQINLGRDHKVQAGDELTLFNVKQFADPFGQQYHQFVLHPAPLVVKQVFRNTATVAAADNSYIGDVQANDYVARQ
jgi:hypothetical protein